jgi:hypothetical protein
VAVVGASAVTALAFTEPSSAPPGGNVPAPINVGGIAQTKAGNISLFNTFGGGNTLTLNENQVNVNNSPLYLNWSNNQSVQIGTGAPAANSLTVGSATNPMKICLNGTAPANCISNASFASYWSLGTTWSANDTLYNNTGSAIRVQNVSPGDGYAMVVGGTNAHSGYLGIHKPGGSRIGYIGWDPAAFLINVEQDDFILHTTSGSNNFSGARNYFSDVENAGLLRVGSAWGMPGIYAESGRAVVGGANGVSLQNNTVTVAANGTAKFVENIGTRGADPYAGLPSGWGGGVHTWDVYAQGTIGVGPSGGPAKVRLANNGTTYADQYCFNSGGVCLTPTGSVDSHWAINGTTLTNTAGNTVSISNDLQVNGNTGMSGGLGVLGFLNVGQGATIGGSGGVSISNGPLKVAGGIKGSESGPSYIFAGLTGGVYYVESVYDGSRYAALTADSAKTQVSAQYGGNMAYMQASASGANGWKPGGGTWADSSDERLKKNIAPISGALDKIMELNPVHFDWKNPSDHAGVEHTGGFIAQEVQKVFPQFVITTDAKGGDKALVGSDGRAYALSLPFEFDAYMVTAVKEQQKTIESLESKLDAQQQRIDALEAKVEALGNH